MHFWTGLEHCPTNACAVYWLDVFATSTILAAYVLQSNLQYSVGLLHSLVMPLHHIKCHARAQLLTVCRNQHQIAIPGDLAW